MKRALIDPEICKCCVACAVDEKCPQKAIIREEPTDKPWIDFTLCRGCMKCKQFCGFGAICEEVKPCNKSFMRSW